MGNGFPDCKEAVYSPRQGQVLGTTEDDNQRAETGPRRGLSVRGPAATVAVAGERHPETVWISGPRRSEPAGPHLHLSKIIAKAEEPIDLAAQDDVAEEFEALEAKTPGQCNHPADKLSPSPDRPLLPAAKVNTSDSIEAPPKCGPGRPLFRGGCCPPPNWPKIRATMQELMKVTLEDIAGAVRPIRSKGSATVCALEQPAKPSRYNPNMCSMCGQRIYLDGEQGDKASSHKCPEQL